MYRLIYFISLVALLFNGIGALTGGALLMYAPDGSKLGMTSFYLQHTPFNNYFIPGLILFLFNGLPSIAVAVYAATKKRDYAVFIFLQGTVLFFWIFIQAVMMQAIYFQHLVMGGTGLFLMLAGNLLYIWKQEKTLAAQGN